MTLVVLNATAPKMKFSIKDFFSKCDEIHRKLQIWSHFLKESLMENFFCVQCVLVLAIYHAKIFPRFSCFFLFHLPYCGTCLMACKISCKVYVKAGVPEGCILDPLSFLVYINDLPNGMFSNFKLFADNTYIFSVAKDHIISTNKLNEDLSKFFQWAYRWKMTFNPDVSKQAQEVIFSCKKNVNNLFK